MGNIQHARFSTPSSFQCNMSYSCCFSSYIPKALPSLLPKYTRTTPLHVVNFKHKQFNIVSKLRKKVRCVAAGHGDHHDDADNFSFAIKLGALLALVGQPALAVTGVNNEEDFGWGLTQAAICAFLYFILAPPIILNWVRVRMYRRKLLEMYLQFMFVFIFYAGIILWAPFLNFRRFPRDPTMKNPWDKPQNPSQIKNDYLKYPWASPEDYD